MALTEQDVFQILKLVEQSSFDELDLEADGLKLVIRKKGSGPVVTQTDPPPALPEADRTVKAKAADPPLVASVSSGDNRKETTVQQDGLVPIKAPILGMFYSRPAPESPPFVEVGSYVKADETVCLLEVMKVFTAVKAGVNGTIEEILAEENTMVEYGHPLFMIRPDADVKAS